MDVALPLPLARTFTYRLDGAAAAGSRVRVPFGPRRLIGWVVGPGQASAGAPAKDVLEVLDPGEPAVPADLLDLCRWIADYYLAPVGQVLRAALPAALSAPTRPDPRPRTRRVLRIARELPSLLEREEVFGRAARQRECYELLESSGGEAEAAHLTQHAGFSASVLKGLVAKGLCALVDEEETRDPFTHLDAIEPPRHTPTDRQAGALAALVAAARALRPGARGSDASPTPAARGTDASPTPAADPRPFLLHGVTGSGKTLVYIELLREVVDRLDRGAIVLVPEIALTPQTVGRFRSRFGDTVAVLHSALSDGERYDAWRALKAGERRIAVGARSAIFAPVRDLGAIIVDEEHESSYKQSETPRYHAREVAVMRARLAGAVCVLGSATPALESWNAVEQRKFRLLELPERVEGRPLPPVR
ncbi:MAG TPA: primosomal protein N', partial [Longimicrobiales bacterium]|nr:primosomal protein N' [Longimicrobiales bacterium]